MTTAADTLAKLLADAVDDGTISLALADRMLSNAVRNAEPCPICHVGRGRQCITALSGLPVAPHANRTAAAK